MRLVALSLALALSLDQAAFAQTKDSGTVVDNAVRRIRSVVIYGDDPCPKATNPDEVVVCARRPEEERYRLPPTVREQAIKKRSSQSWAARARDMDRVGSSIPGTCTAVGPAGESACAMNDIQNAAAERRQAASDQAADEAAANPRADRPR